MNRYLDFDCEHRQLTAMLAKNHPLGSPNRHLKRNVRPHAPEYLLKHTHQVRMLLLHMILDPVLAFRSSPAASKNMA